MEARPNRFMNASPECVFPRRCRSQHQLPDEYGRGHGHGHGERGGGEADGEGPAEHPRLHGDQLEVDDGPHHQEHQAGGQRKLRQPRPPVGCRPRSGCRRSAPNHTRSPAVRSLPPRRPAQRRSTAWAPPAPPAGAKRRRRSSRSERPPAPERAALERRPTRTTSTTIGRCPRLATRSGSGQRRPQGTGRSAPPDRTPGRLHPRGRLCRHHCGRVPGDRGWCGRGPALRQWPPGFSPGGRSRWEKLAPNVVLGRHALPRQEGVSRQEGPRFRMPLARGSSSRAWCRRRHRGWRPACSARRVPPRIGMSRPTAWLSRTLCRPRSHELLAGHPRHPARRLGACLRSLEQTARRRGPHPGRCFRWEPTSTREAADRPAAGWPEERASRSTPR